MHRNGWDEVRLPLLPEFESSKQELAVFEGRRSGVTESSGLPGGTEHSKLGPSSLKAVHREVHRQLVELINSKFVVVYSRYESKTYESS